MGREQPPGEDRFVARREHPGRSNGRRPKGARTRPSALPDRLDEPVDIAAVQADDELINAIASGMPVSAPGLGGYDVDDHVVAMLAAWRAEVDEEPIPDLVDLDTAMATVRSAQADRSRNRRRHLATLAAAAALIVVAVTGVSLTAEAARPGDALWGVSKVLYSERAESVEAAAGVQTHLERARAALENGETEVAAQELELAQAVLPAVRVEEGQPELVEAQHALAAALQEADPEAIEEQPPVVAPGTTEPDPAPEGPGTTPGGADPGPTTAPTTPPSSSTPPTTPTTPTSGGTADPSATAEGSTDPSSQPAQSLPGAAGATGTSADGTTTAGGVATAT
ncbi:MAG TPA: anti-sigma-D factor RsdA [Pseudonocardia sp.]|nr:anti-sigma-D factor RsdA [Pseudonocardia sp.]